METPSGEYASSQPTSSTPSSEVSRSSQEAVEERAISKFIEEKLVVMTNSSIDTIRYLFEHTRRSEGKRGRESWQMETLSAVEKVLEKHAGQHMLLIRSALHQWAMGGSIDGFITSAKVFDEENIQQQMAALVSSKLPLSSPSHSHAMPTSPKLKSNLSIKTTGFGGAPAGSTPTGTGTGTGTGTETGTGTPEGQGSPSRGASGLPKHMQSPKSGEGGTPSLLRTASNSWKQAVKGVIRRQRREKVQDRPAPASGTEAQLRKVVPKSEATRERLRAILGRSFLFGDLEPGLREEIIDAFQDLRITPGTEIIKQGDIADNFYVVDVGEFDIITKHRNEAPLVTRTKGAEEIFGELALMYDAPRNATVRATSHALLWFVDRATFKSIILRHLTESPIAQVLREVPAFTKLSTREIIHFADHARVDTFHKGQVISRAGSLLDKVYVIQEGQVRATCPGVTTKTVLRTNVTTEVPIAIMSRLNVFDTSVILNQEKYTTVNYTAATDQTTIISFDRALLTPMQWAASRKGLQAQLVTTALQRVPALAELSSDQLALISDAFTEEEHPAGTEITKQGQVQGMEARIYVVQCGRIGVYRSGDDSMEAGGSQSYTGPPAPQLPLAHAVSLPAAANAPPWSRIGSMLRPSGGSAPGTPRSHSFAKQLTPSSLGGAVHAARESLLRIGSTAAGGHGGQQGSVGVSLEEPEEKELMSEDVYTCGSPKFGCCNQSKGLQLMTYGVIGEECLFIPGSKGSEITCHATAVVESLEGAVLLSVTVEAITQLLGPIQELLVRVANQRSLRAVPCLECVTEYEIEDLAKGMGVRKLAPGATVYKAGDPADRLYIIRRGHVLEMPLGWAAEGTVPSSPSGRLRGEVKVLGKGMFFGEESLLSADPRLTNFMAGNGGPGVPPNIGAEVYYLDRAVFEANLGPLQELQEMRRKRFEQWGIEKSIQLEELEEIGLLGTGLFGKVKLVYNKRTDQHYALKCVSKAKVVRMQEEEHLRNEKQLMSELDHPFITKLIRTYKDEDNVYLLQELTTGRELFLLMERVGRLQEWEAAFYAGSVLLALENMHNRNIVYRDLKPENTLISDNGYPKLIDMGFAKRLAPGRRTYSMCGTPDYMAPEIIKRQGHGRAVDYWALGCMIYEMITNTSPFNRGDDPPQVVFQRITEGRVSFPSFMSAVAVDIVKRLLDGNPETRLGMGKRGIAEIREHPFFAEEINFQLLIRQKEYPPMIPQKPANYADLCIKEDPSHDDGPKSPVDPKVRHDYWDDIF